METRLSKEETDRLIFLAESLSGFIDDVIYEFKYSQLKEASDTYKKMESLRSCLWIFSTKVKAAAEASK